MQSIKLRRNKMTLLREIVSVVFVVIGVIIIAKADRIANRIFTMLKRVKNTQPEDAKEKEEINFEENKTSKSPAENLTEELEEAYKRTGDPGLGIILQFRQMDAEIEKLREKK